MRVLACILCLTASLAAADDPSTTRAQLERFRQLQELVRLVEDEYAHAVDQERLWQAAFAGLIDGLDGSSRYLDREAALLQPGDDAARPVGFGFSWRYDEARRAVRVTRVVPGSSAAEAGLLRHDRILAIDDRPVADHHHRAAQEHLASMGDRVRLQIRHTDGQQAEFDLVRRVYEDPGLHGPFWLDRTHGVALIDIDVFRQGAESRRGPGPARSQTARALRQMLDQLENQGLQALVIDLRGNAGGSLPAAVECADCFLTGLPERTTEIVRQVSRHPSRQLSWPAHSAATYPHRPLVVVVDEDTASSAELFAGALQDHRRALLVGGRTRGKATVQQRFRLPWGASVALTVAEFRTPAGGDLAGGLVPDLIVSDPPEDVLARGRRGGEPRTNLGYDQPLLRALELARSLARYDDGRP